MSSTSDSLRKNLEKQFRKLDVGPADEALEAAFEALAPEASAFDEPGRRQTDDAPEAERMSTVRRRNGRGTSDDGEQQAN